MGIRNVMLLFFLLVQFSLLHFSPLGFFSCLGSRHKADQRLYHTGDLFGGVEISVVFHPLSFPEPPKNSGTAPIQLSLGTWLTGSLFKVVQVQAVQARFQRAELLC